MSRRFLASESMAALVALVAVVGLFSAINGQFLARMNLEGIVVSAAISVVVSLGMTFVIAMKSLDLSVGSNMGFAAIVTAMLLSQGTSLVLAVPAALLATGALGLANGLLIVLLRLPSFVATLATFSVIFGFNLLLTHGAAVTVRSAALNDLVIGHVFGVLPSAAVIAALVFVVMLVLFQRTPFGRHVAAIGGELRAAVGAGINIPMVTIAVFTLSGALAGLSGIMTAGLLQNADSTVGSGGELMAIAVVVVGGTSLAGGRGNLPGTVLAALLLAAIKSGLNVTNVPSLYEGLIFGGILIVALIIDGARRGQRRKGMLVV